MAEEQASPQSYYLFETGTGPGVLPADAVRHRIENATVMGMPTAGPRFDAAVVLSPRQIVPAIDLRARGVDEGAVASPVQGQGGQGPAALVLGGVRSVGLIVDRLNGIVELAPAMVFPLSAAQREQLPEYVSAVTFMQGKPVAVFDPDLLCAEDEMLDPADVSSRLDRRKKPRTGTTPRDPVAA